MLKQDTDKKKSKSDLCHSTGFCLNLLYTTESASSVSFFDILLEIDIALHSSKLFYSLFWYRLLYTFYFSSFTY